MARVSSEVGMGSASADREKTWDRETPLQAAELSSWNKNNLKPRMLWEGQYRNICMIASNQAPFFLASPLASSPRQQSLCPQCTGTEDKKISPQLWSVFGWLRNETVKILLISKVYLSWDYPVFLFPAAVAEDWISQRPGQSSLPTKHPQPAQNKANERNLQNAFLKGERKFWRFLWEMY